MKFFLKKEVAETRYAVCQSCDQLTDLKVCRRCTCFMPFKTRLPMVDCPLGKWTQSNDVNENDPIQFGNEPPENNEEIIIVP